MVKPRLLKLTHRYYDKIIFNGENHQLSYNQDFIRIYYFFNSLFKFFFNLCPKNDSISSLKKKNFLCFYMIYIILTLFGMLINTLFPHLMSPGN
ncbi:hypothetical protein BpHYR1_013746 [Brachionus plicatilis]|uniref:Uncharacterized protein n=1 Tax=Brachionus plicatilis TaxID=10195 RepID=A0A3M7PBA7_BRAPC|nr:hypothetical protein BpHYR1_013746 [Brachionus plicatilis]